MNKKSIYHFLTLIIFLFFFTLFTKKTLAVSCPIFSVSVSGSSAIVTIGNCDTNGSYVIQILKDDKVIIAEDVLVNNGQAQKEFHLTGIGEYVARLISSSIEVINQSSFNIQNSSALSCGDPCNQNDPNCPPQCVATYVDGGWFCYVQTTFSPPGNGSTEPAINFNAFKNLIPGLKPEFTQGASGVYPILSDVMKYVYVIAGLLLLFSLIAGGFQMMMGSRDEKGLMAARGRITNALVGFLLLFVSYWIVQIMEYILGITIF